MKRTITTRWRGETPVYVIAMSLFALSAIILAQHNIYPNLWSIYLNAQMFLSCIIAIGLFDVVYFLARQRPTEPLAALLARYISSDFRDFVISGLPILALLAVLMPFFSEIKAAVNLFNDYTWDVTFIAWDRALFGGYDAWHILQPVLGYPAITAALAFLYHLWFLLLYAGCLFFAFGQINPLLRRQFFLTYILSWMVIGGLMAIWLASVGPCFIGPILGDPTFDAQMAYLHAADQQFPVMTLPIQQLLIDWFRADVNGLGSGITAMPSMHVAIAFLFWLAMRQYSRRLGIAFGLFFAFTWISSVHLAYHYAVDGLVSVIAVYALWGISHFIVSAWDRFLIRRNYSTDFTKTVPAE